jgi:hypothetical protein
MEVAVLPLLKGEVVVGSSEHRAHLPLPKSGHLCLPSPITTMMTGRWLFKKTLDPGASSLTMKKKPPPKE